MVHNHEYPSVCLPKLHIGLGPCPSRGYLICKNLHKHLKICHFATIFFWLLILAQRLKLSNLNQFYSFVFRQILTLLWLLNLFRHSLCLLRSSGSKSGHIKILCLDQNTSIHRNIFLFTFYIQSYFKYFAYGPILILSKERKFVWLQIFQFGSGSSFVPMFTGFFRCSDPDPIFIKVVWLWFF